jgi:flavodoxin
MNQMKNITELTNVKTIIFLALTIFCVETNMAAQNKTQNILVAYFSKTGTTEAIAGFVHNTAGGDVFKIVPVKPYPVDYNATLTQARQELNQNVRPALSGSVPSIDAYDVIFLGYPIWFGYEPMIIRTFLEACDVSGKTVIPFCTSGSSGIGSSVRSIRSLASGATVLDGRRFSAGARLDVNAWIDALNITTGGR